MHENDARDSSMRIVSLLPSATEIICELGLRDSLVGVTHECDYPTSVLDLPKITRTLVPGDATSAEIDSLVRERLRSRQALYALDLPVLASLHPELIVTQALCDVCAVAEEEVRAAACALPGRPRVVNLEPVTLAGVFDAIRQVATAAGAEVRAGPLITSLQARVGAVAARTEKLAACQRVTFLEWIDPPFSCGHWNPELVRLAGGTEGHGQEASPSRTLSWQEIQDWRPEVLFIACCGFTTRRSLQDLPILRSSPGWDRLPCVVDGRVYVADGSAYFSRPGPRLVDSLEILAHALHPGIHPLPPGLTAALKVDSNQSEK
jgi:iron complex transport system substrate-binding protein